MKIFKIILVTYILIVNLSVSYSADFVANVMAPLLVGDINNINSLESQKAWNELDRGFAELKRIGVHAITTDLWWGAIEKQEGIYNWAYYDKFISLVEKNGLRWIPILSFHQLGGNVGDVGFIPIPDYIWTKHIGKPGVVDENSLKYKSEQGNFSREYVSAHATDYVLEDYKRFMVAFRNHFEHKAHLIDEVNISLGPAGELRYPSYNMHDKNAGYPTRGSLQAYSDISVESFRNFVLNKYKSIENINLNWGSNLSSVSDIYPPDPFFLDSVFYKKGDHFANYGKDFFKWYNSSLVDHGRKVLSVAKNILNTTSTKFKGVEIGAKLPGIHWLTGSSRLAELSAGLIHTDYQDWYSFDSGYGYKDTLSLFKDLNKDTGLNSKVILHFTALEMNDGRGGPPVASRAKSLVFWMAQTAQSQGIIIKGENALGDELENRQAWYNMADALKWGNYKGITLLRYQRIVNSNNCKNSLFRLISSRAETPNMFFL